MRILTLAKSFINDTYYEDKLKREIDKMEELVKEMSVYESMTEFVSNLSTSIKKNGKNYFYEKIMEKGAFDTNSIKKLAIITDNKEVLKYLPKETFNFTKEENQILKSMFEAEYNKKDITKIENIAFSGGGAKGFAHAGVFDALEENNINVKSVAGTSAGALIALLSAFNYSGDEAKSAVLNTDFSMFLQESIMHDSILGNVLKAISPEKRALMYRTTYLDAFKKNMEKETINFIINHDIDKNILHLEYEDGISINQRKSAISSLLQSQVFTREERDVLEKELIKERKLKEDDVPFSALIEFSKDYADRIFLNEIKKDKNLKPSDIREKLMLGFQNEKDAINGFFRMYIDKENIIEEFFGDIIENKLSLLSMEELEKVRKGFSETNNFRNANFKDLKRLSELYPEKGFKDLAICICERVSDNPLELFKKDNYKQIDVHAGNEDPDYFNMPIKTAVRISMNLPGAFSAYEYNGKKYVDGGVRANFPMHYYDKILKSDPNKTIGFALAPEENYTRTNKVDNVTSPMTPLDISEPNTIKRLFKRMMNDFSHYYQSKVYGQKLDNNKKMNAMDYNRIVILNVGKVGTNDFDLTRNGKITLMKSGFKAATKLFNGQHNAQKEHYKNAVVAHGNKIKNTFEKLSKNRQEKIRERKINIDNPEQLIYSNVKNMISLSKKIKQEEDEKIRKMRNTQQNKKRGF